MQSSGSDPFKIDGPAVVSFSGGRTSAYMLKRILDAHGGKLPQDVFVLFANVGKERLETLDFVSDCEKNFGVQIRWIEWDADAGYKETSWLKASRKGEPFDALIERRKCLPNPIMRMCTQELKIRPMKKWMQASGYKHWDMVLGIRADEPRRVANLRKDHSEVWEHVLPLADAGISEEDVLAFWRKQPFDLRLQSYEGNCDLCFMKSRAKRARLLKEHPEFADWWIAAEERCRDQFKREEPSYRRMRDLVLSQMSLFDTDTDRAEGPNCLCHD